MNRYLASIVVVKPGGKFRKTHFAEIGAPTSAAAFEHLRHRCEPGREFARKFPDCTFANPQVIALDALPLVRHGVVLNRDLLPDELVCE